MEVIPGFDFNFLILVKIMFLVAIAIAVYGGMQLDKWIKPGMPLAVWLLPLLFITGIILKIIRDTSTKK